MWKEIAGFEIKYHLKQPLFHLTVLAFFLMAFGLISTDAGLVLSHAPTHIDRNAPFVIINAMTFMTLLGLFVVTAFVASSALRDFEQDTHMLFFTRPVSKFDYLFGRFAGSMAVSLLIFLALGLGQMAGAFAPWQEAGQLGPFRIAPYLYGLGIMVVPDLLMMGAVFFAVAIWSRRLLVTYICVVVFLGLQDFGQDLVGDIESRFLASLLEPSGLTALENTVRYWTVSEYNAQIPEILDVLLPNRVLWIGVGLLFLLLGYLRFDYARASADKKKKAPAPARDRYAAPLRTTLDGMTSVERSFSGGSVWRQLLRLARLETGEVLKTTPFFVLMAMSLLFIIPLTFLIGQYRGTPSYPLTHWMLEAIQAAAQMSLVVIVIFYSGELIFNDRTRKRSNVNDALPVADWVWVISKLLTLTVVIATFLLVGMLATVASQLLRGFTDIEPGLYVKGFLVIGWPFVVLAALALFLQILSKNKFIGFLLIILLLIVRAVLPELGLEHNLYRFGGRPRAFHSDMNGYDLISEPLFWFSLYWSLGAAILVVLSILLRARGEETSLKARISAARQRWSGSLRIVTALLLVGFASTGAWIFYNTNVLSEYATQKSRIAQQAEYEQKYSPYRDADLPSITAVRAEMDIFPHDRRVEIRGRYTLENRSGAPITLLPVTMSPKIVEGILAVHGGVTLKRIELPEHEVRVDDEKLRFHVYELAESLEPGETMDLGFEVLVDQRGFCNRRPETLVVDNGTFFANWSFFPLLGYMSSNELLDQKVREKRGLPPAKRMADVNDRAARNVNYLHADWIDFEVTLSTRIDQIAVAPGNLLKEWTEGDRRYFHYKTEAPIINMLAFVSARFERAQDRWNDVAIEILHHERHDFHVDRFMRAAKISLDYMTEHFGPYPHRELRIVEIPNYHGQVAMAVAQMIPFSEMMGFTSRIGKNDLDHLTFVTAHEIAHQWWNHQVVPADVQGSTMVAEALAQYSALMIMEKEHGPEMVRHFLKYELDRYLEGRSDEKIGEMPLVLVENQMYIHYAKGALAMYGLRDYIGEQALNRALGKFLDARAFKGAPYPTSVELVDCIREAVPARYGHLVEDLFETITLFDNRVKEASCSEQEDGTFLVKLEVSSRKLRADGQGAETEIPLDDWIDIGVFAETGQGREKKEKVLFMEKRRIHDSDMTFDIVVDEKPARAGIDPYNKLIDRVADDNVMEL
jgi:ABC-type transport system involved in multi-copper enzyme maturation permease subunit